MLCTTILFVIIVPSNILVVKVWNMRKGKTPIPLLLSTIAISDSIYIGLDTFVRILFYTNFANGRCVGGHIIWPFEHASHYMSTLVTTYIAIQRCMVCAFPFKGPKLFGYRTSAIYIGVVCIIVILQQAAWTVFIKGLDAVEVTTGNTTQTFCHIQLSIPRKTYERIGHIGRVSTVFINHISTFIIVIICMTYCVYTLQFKRMQSSQKSSKSTTVMIVLVMLLFTIGQLPAAIGLFVDNFIDQTWFWVEDRVYISSAVNKVSFALHIVVYLVMSRQFREDFFSIFCFRPDETSSVSSKKTESMKVSNISNK